MPPVLPSPTNAQRQAMMPRSVRSVRSIVRGANWGPEVSSALATTIPMRPATAPQRATYGYQVAPLVMEMNAEDLPCVPSLETPTNSQRQPMMSRSIRSVRTRIAETEHWAPPTSPSTAPTREGVTPKARGLNVASLETESLDGGSLQLTGLATPTNLDRKNAQMPGFLFIFPFLKCLFLIFLGLFLCNSFPLFSRSQTNQK